MGVEKKYINLSVFVVGTVKIIDWEKGLSYCYRRGNCMTVTSEHLLHNYLDDIVVLGLRYNDKCGTIPVLRVAGAQHLYTDELGELFVKSKQRLLVPSAAPDGAFVGGDGHRYTLIDKECGDGAKLYAIVAARVEDARERLRDIIHARGYATIIETEIVN